MWINALNSLASCSGNNWDSSYSCLLGTNLSKDQAEDAMYEYLRNTLVTKVHFKIENLFSNILKENKAEYNQRGFSNICNDVLILTNKNDDEEDNKKTLSILANLRNSYHSNGIHNNKTTSPIEICFLEFNFEEGKKVECASWEHILVAINANISIINSILLSDKVSEMNEILVACN